MTAIVLDTETTGFNQHTDRITEVAMMDFDSGDVLLRTYVNPLREIPEEIVGITGITNEMVQAGQVPTFAQIADIIASHIHTAEAIIAHNPWFDQRMLSAELHRVGVDSVKWPILVCTKRLWDIHEPKTQRHLTNAYKRFVDHAGFEGAHGALADTKATHAVIHAQIKAFGLEGIKWADFDPEQKTWYGTSNHVIWDRGILRVNWGKHKGTPVHEVPSGYWNWVRGSDFPEHIKVLCDYLCDVNRGCSADDLASWAYGAESE